MRVIAYRFFNTYKRPLLTIILIAITIIIYQKITKRPDPVLPRETRIKNDCFLYQRNMKVFPSMLEGKTKPNAPGKLNKNIFFHVTSCTKDGVIRLSPKAACAIESAARWHPDWEVFVLFTAKIGFNNATRLPLIDQLTSYPNIHFRHVNIDSYVKETPLEEWLAVGDLYYSSFFAVHLSDTLRFLTLWKYGGTYLDLDIVVMKSLNPLMTNYAGEEIKIGASIINNAVINFDSQKGHFIVDECLRELRETFNGKVWGHNGVLLLTRVMCRLCNSTLASEMTHERCNFQVLPINYFYANSYAQPHYIFDSRMVNDVLGIVKDSYLVHTWNHLSFQAQVETGSAYSVLANIHCNKVYNQSGGNF